MLEMNFNPFPVLTTDRLVLRQLDLNDAEAVFFHRSDERVNEHLENFRHTSIEQTRAFIDQINSGVAENRSIFWVISQKGSKTLIGTICLWNISNKEEKCDTGYTLDPKFHKMGYMNEALVKVIDFGFNTMKLKKIDAYTNKKNADSIKLLLRNKFKEDLSQKKEAGLGGIIFSLSNG